MLGMERTHGDSLANDGREVGRGSSDRAAGSAVRDTDGSAGVAKVEQELFIFKESEAIVLGGGSTELGNKRGDGRCGPTLLSNNG